MNARGGARERNGHFYAYTRYGRGKQVEIRVPWATSEDQAKARGVAIGEAADALVGIGRRDLVRPFARELAEAHTDARLSKVQKAIDRIVSGARAVGATGDMTFGDWARRWTSGELADEYPDHVKRKDSTDDVSRLDKYILPQVGDVPIGAFKLAHANLVMKHLPAMSAGNRRQVAQIVSRVLHLAVWPGQLIAQSPIPRGWLPKVKRRRDYSCLFPREEALLLGHAETSEAFRLFCGVLNREGMRLSELLDSEWWQWGEDCRTFRATKTKTGDPRMWAVRPDTAASMRAWRDKNGTEQAPFAYVAAMGDRTKLAERFRGALKAAGVTRPELFEDTEHTGKLRAHDMRATFVTMSLAQGRPDTWIRDRTAHKSTSMIDRYRRHARQLAELESAELVDLVDALGWSTSGSSASSTQGAGRVLESPSGEDPREEGQASESTEGGTRTLTPRGRRILNTLGRLEQAPDELNSRWKATSRDAAKRPSSTLPAPPSRHPATPAADSEAPLDGSTRPPVRCRLEVDGAVVASTRQGAPDDVAGELAEELRRAGVPAAAAGPALRVAIPGEWVDETPPKRGPAKVRDRDVKPEKRRRGAQ